MDESLRAQIEINLSHLDGLIRRGRRLRETLAENPSGHIRTRSHSRLATRYRRGGQSIVRGKQGPLARASVQRSIFVALNGWACR